MLRHDNTTKASRVTIFDEAANISLQSIKFKINCFMFFGERRDCLTKHNKFFFTNDFSLRISSVNLIRFRVDLRFTKRSALIARRLRSENIITLTHDEHNQRLRISSAALELNEILKENFNFFKENCKNIQIYL